MDTVRRYRNSILRKCLVVCGCMCCCFVALHKTPLLSGFLLGASISMINFYLLAVDMTKLSIFDLSRFRSFMIVRYFLRYGIVALALYSAVLYGLNIVLFVIGLLLVYMTIMIENVVKVKQA